MENNMLAGFPKIGFGTADLDEETAERAVYTAIKTGYRLVDTAPVYGTEAAVGRAVRRCLEEGVCRREELIIETKVSNADQGYDSTLALCEKSLSLLGLDYIDSYLIHWPVPKDRQDTYKELNRETWRAMKDLRRAGKVRGIGVCNFLPRHIENIGGGGELPIINQLELHPAYQQSDTLVWCRERGILVEAWSPFGAGKVFRDEKLRAFASSLGMSLAGLIFSWHLARGTVPIVRSGDGEHIARDFREWEAARPLSDGDTAALREFDTPDGHMDFWNYKRMLQY